MPLVNNMVIMCQAINKYRNGEGELHIVPKTTPIDTNPTIL